MENPDLMSPLELLRQIRRQDAAERAVSSASAGEAVSYEERWEGDLIPRRGKPRETIAEIETIIHTKKQSSTQRKINLYIVPHGSTWLHSFFVGAAIPTYSPTGPVANVEAMGSQEVGPGYNREAREDVETMENLLASPKTLEDMEGLKMSADAEVPEFPTELEELELPADPEEPQMPSNLANPGSTQPADSGPLPLGTVLNTALTDRGEISEYYSQHLGTRVVIDDDIDAEPWARTVFYRRSDLPLLAGLTPAEVVEVDRCLSPAVAAEVLPRQPELEGTEAEIWDAYLGFDMNNRANTTGQGESLTATLVKSLAERFRRSAGRWETVCYNGPPSDDRSCHLLVRFMGHETFIRTDARTDVRIAPGGIPFVELTF